MRRFIPLIFFSFFYCQHTYCQAIRWVIVNGCWLNVDGITNINKFSCVITDYSRPDTLVISGKNSSPVHLNGSMQLDVQKFDCHNRVMTADLRKTLKVKEFPKLIIRFVSLDNYPDVVNKQESINGIVLIELAGVSRRYEVAYKVVIAEKTCINLVGSRKVNFSDFDIEPPRKLGGMIRTNNELSVVFNLRMKVLD